jgi:hypothetical protein
MVSFGPWIEEPDWDYIQTIRVTDPGRYESAGVNGTDSEVTHRDESPTGEPGYLIEMSDITDLWTTAVDPINRPAGRVGFTWEYTLAIPYWTSTWSVTIVDGAWLIAPPDSGFQFSTGTAWPDDAVGIRYDGHAWNPDDPWSGDVDLSIPNDGIVAVRLEPTTKLASTAEDASRLPPDDNRDLRSPFRTNIVLNGAGAPQIVTHRDGAQQAHDGEVTLDVETDLTDLLRAGDWSGLLYSHTPLEVAPAREPEALPYHNGSMTYGMRITEPRVRWTLNAIRYQFVYDTTVAPYRRIFPRDDGLAGGAPRTWPPSKAVQSSNRTSGGYL